MKLIYKTLSVILGLFVLLFIILFTPVGNSVVKPFLESTIKKETQLESRLEKFSLTMSSLEILLKLNEKNSLFIKGNYSLFRESFDLNYIVDLKELDSLTPLTQAKLKGELFSDGDLRGDMDLFKVEGKSTLAKSETTYKITLENFNPTSIIAEIKSLDLETLLYMLNQKEYATALVNLDVNFKSIVEHRLDGDIKLETLGGVLNSKVLQNDFNITVPYTKFSMNLDALLKGDNINYNYRLSSNLAKVTSSGDVIAEPLTLDLDYSINVKELALFKPLSGLDFRGALQVKGDVKGDASLMNVNAHSNIASSKTDVKLTLKEFTASSIDAKIKGLKIEKLLFMLKQPHYTDGLFDLNAKITNAKVGSLTGSVDTKLYKGLLDSAYLTKAYEFKSPMPRTTYAFKSETQLQGSSAVSRVKLTSTLADLELKKAVFEITTQSLESDYKVKLHDLSKLYFVAQRKLKGSLVANGEIKKAKDLDFTLHSDVAQGKIDAKLHNDNFHADILSLETLDILEMLCYPKILHSKIDGKLDYNLLTSKGKLEAYLKEGKFTKNQVLDLAKEYAKTDMYKERFNGDIRADINAEKIIASLELKSKRSSITTQDAKLNSKTQKIDAKIDINANGNPLLVKLKGDVNAPKVSVDATKLIQKEATKAVKKELEKQLGNDVGKLFKGLF